MSGGANERARSQAPRVFVSYSHESAAHKERVLGLAQRLRGDGVDAWVDCFVAAPAQGWVRWIQDEVAVADFVVLVCTKVYCERFEGRAAAGVGRGVNFEGLIAGQLLYDGELDHARVIPVLFDAEDLACVPIAARAGSRYVLDGGYGDLLGHLRGTLAVEAAPLGVPVVTVGAPEQPTLPEQLAELERRLEAETFAGADTSGMREQILELRRAIRSGPGLVSGEVLGGRYRVREVVGSGGFAQVWAAWDLADKQPVAVKVLHGQFNDDASQVERFVKGAEKLARLGHTGLVKIIGSPAVHDEHHHFFVMEWCAGGDLRKVRDRRAALSAIADALEGLEHAHDAGLVHRDVKPGNILIDARGRGRMSDFDLVRDDGSTHGTRTGAGMGTFAYAAPEQLDSANKADARADVYGAAMTVGYVLGGWENPPVFPMLTRPAWVDGLNCGVALKTALRGALVYDRDQRTTSCLPLVRAIRDELEGGEVLQAWWAELTGRDECGHWATLRVGDVVQRMRWIEAGSFLMGSPPDEVGRRENEGPQHVVTIGEGFWLADTPCTYELWEAVMGTHPAAPGSPLHPVRYVSFTEVEVFLRKIDELVPGFGATLPTEAQWEYACRAGTTAATYAAQDVSLDEIGWHLGNAANAVHAVASKRYNAWGLYDMLGNVWEWCMDGSRRNYTADPISDPIHRTGSARVLRGGSWASTSRGMRAAFRSADISGARDRDIGFRLAGSQAPAPSDRMDGL